MEVPGLDMLRAWPLGEPESLTATLPSLQCTGCAPRLDLGRAASPVRPAGKAFVIAYG